MDRALPESSCTATVSVKRQMDEKTVSDMLRAEGRDV